MPRYIEELVSQQVQRSALARRRAEEAGEPPALPVVTISRTTGTGARIVAAELAAELGWSFWDRELIDAIAENADVSCRLVEAFDERAHSELEIFVRTAFGDHEIGGFLYARHLARAVGVIAKLGNAVILGRGANFLLPDALSVRIEASEAHRIQNMIRFENLTHEQAVSAIRASDRERRDFFLKLFGHHRVERCVYDLTICMDHFTTGDAVGLIRMATRARFGVPRTSP